MSRRTATAKAARRPTPPVVDPELVAQAHDRLHRDDVDGCHELLHAAMGSGAYTGDVAPLVTVIGFDAGFRELCTRHGIRASYVAIDAGHPRPDGAARLVSGGDAELDAHVTRAMRPAGG